MRRRGRSDRAPIPHRSATVTPPMAMNIHRRKWRPYSDRGAELVPDTTRWFGSRRRAVAASLGALIWLLGPVVAVFALLLPPVSHEIGNGNIHLLLAAAIVAAVRAPGWWALPLLTKVTPEVGALWHAFQGGWRSVGLAVTVTRPGLPPRRTGPSRATANEAYR